MTERENLEHLGVDGEIILKRILKRSVRRAWTVLAQIGNRWRALVNAVMNPGGSIKCGEFLD